MTVTLTTSNTSKELNLKLKDSNNIRESDISINEIDTLESILGRLSDLKYGAETRAQACQSFEKEIGLVEPGIATSSASDRAG